MGKATINGGFFGKLKDINAKTTVYNVYKRFVETGRFKAIECERNDDNKPHIFFDSDVAKWIEAAAYIIRDYGDTKLVEYCDNAIAFIQKNQLDDGYFNSYFQVYEPENIFRKRMDHELYCAGHMIEAAVAYAQSTGKTTLLDCMKKYADLIYKVFYVEKSAAFLTGGHPEIELALMRLYKYTADKKYLELAEYFIKTRGTTDEVSYAGSSNPYDQSHAPLTEQDKAEGHSVRALYLYSGAADLAYELNDEKLKAAMEKLYSNIVNERMYITGGCGSTAHGEAFTYDYDLPNESAYAETCAGIALMMFCKRMAAFGPDAAYADTVERALYNNVLAGISTDGKSFFYVNPLEAKKADFEFNNALTVKQNKPILQRLEVFDCSCCPPNVARIIGSIQDFIYSEYEDGIYIDQLISSSYTSGDNTVTVESQLPFGGKVTVKATGGKPVYMRLPMWVDKFETDAKIKTVKPYYVKIENNVEFNFEMEPRAVYPNAAISADAGRKAVTYGPLVMCAEGVDNGGDLGNITFKDKDLKEFKLIDDDMFTIEVEAKRLVTGDELYSYSKPSKEKITLKLIPYFRWANRGVNDMQIWFLQ